MLAVIWQSAADGLGFSMTSIANVRRFMHTDIAEWFGTSTDGQVICTSFLKYLKSKCAWSSLIPEVMRLAHHTNNTSIRQKSPLGDHLHLAFADNTTITSCRA
jgi:hypothetical protein